MLGLEISKAYFNKYALEMIENKFYSYKDYIAGGLVGEGSECFGFDDSISQDHDFGAGFCIWLPQEIYNTIGAKMQEEYNALPQQYCGFNKREPEKYSNDRIGILTIEGFYSKFTNCSSEPKTDFEWLKIPERFLATAVNGEVFCDNYGEFTRIRNILKGFYPEDVLRKKLAARAATVAQAGQYNYMRAMKRNECGAAFFSMGEFVRAALSTIYMLNREYMPFYKWAFKGTENLRILQDTVLRLKDVVCSCDKPENFEMKMATIEHICSDIAKEFVKQGFSKTSDTFLQSHAEDIMQGIVNPQLRNLHIIVDFD